MIALNRTQGRAADPGEMFAVLADEAILASNRELVARIAANTDDSFPDRDVHIKQVALVVLRAKEMA